MGNFGRTIRLLIPSAGFFAFALLACQLGSSSYYALDPSWSPDGGHILFASGQDEGDIYRMALSGRDRVQLTDSDADDRNPAWSPDGKHIAFQSNIGGRHGIYLMDADGGNLRFLVVGTSPNWAPDSTRIVYVANDLGNPDIHAVSIQGGHVEHFVEHEASDRDPAWSPDGKLIAFSSDRDGDWAIYLTEIGEASTIRLVQGTNPSWSPDGQQIVFVLNRGIHIIDLGNGLLTELTDGSYGDWGPSWSPDGQQIVFNSELRSSSMAVYVVSASGGEPTIVAKR